MYSEYRDFDSLKEAVLQDRKTTGIDVYARDRYPIRFILLDNFRDCSMLVDFLVSELHTIVESVDKWIDPDYPDLMITYTELGRCIQNYIRSRQGNDCVIAPFSELARFYDNENRKAFDALVKTIKGIQSSPAAYEKHQRVYVPIVGLEGKMSTFEGDTQCTIWRLHSDAREITYRLILTDNQTFGIRGLERHYTKADNIKEWLNIWKDADKQVTPNIICSSSAIYANAHFAQPDNAFSFVRCDDAFQFMSMGLQLPLGGLGLLPTDDDNWETLASNIDISSGFSLSQFVKTWFEVLEIDDTKTFIKLWLERPEKFDRWLLSRYYRLQKSDTGYICNLLSRITSYTGNDLIEQIALYLNENESDMAERRYCLKEAMANHVVLRDGAQNKLTYNLEAIAAKHGMHIAIKYITGISDKEKELIVSWLANDKIQLSQIKDIYPDLYTYQIDALGVSADIPKWLEGYVNAYKQAKLRNKYEDTDVKSMIEQINASEVTFDGWYQDFSSVRTLLNTRGDIEVFYWVDGLGIDWIPLVKQIVKERKGKGIYLNEVKVARALLPTVTSVNKVDLQKLLPEGVALEKSGDLDAFAHQSTNYYPSSIIDEIDLVRSIIESILDKYVGKKIAIISDHGLSYLPQLASKMGIAGVTPDHHGRIAKRTSGSWTYDKSYIRLEDGKTACALRHDSLCNKVPKGQGIHGGCTPEEVLVPIFVLSGCPSDAHWTSDLLSSEISGADPRARFMIKNMPTSEYPVVWYGGKRYWLVHETGDIYVSEPITLNEADTQMELVIGSVSRIYNITISTGAKEEDLFGF